ncbi:expressed unknown protein [Seminavis robusta]|uniref:Cystatin domain-containing protein n=1 Tax=Seminavis robusta TaxID=568900 RepID=A0A9N8HIT0_9STRA|nr:expressed unknown protein [Seminavis robusta]|eukprot:Sro807_g205270.1 n/a (120) ;mRNA; r:29014-29373
MMMGGYRTAETTGERVVAAAQFALAALVTEHPYKFAATSTMKVVVLKASQQVVQGMNYKLTLAILQENDCVGALECTVWDKFGDLTVTHWGEEVSCSEAMGMIKMKQQQDTTVEKDPET